MHQKNILPAVLVAIVIATGVFFGIRALTAPGAGSIAGKTTTSGMYIAGTGFAVGTEQSAKTVFNSSGQLTMSTGGTAVTGINFGTCYIWAAAQTIAASSSAIVECTGSSAGNDATALTGVSAGDALVVTLASTTPLDVGTGKAGLIVMSATASSTAGFITLRVWNASGSTFTWTPTASTSKFIAFR